MKKENNENADIEIVMGDNSDLNISDVSDCLNTLRPKDKINNKKKNVVIPKTKSEKNK